MQVWNVLHAACWKYRMQEIAKNLPSQHHCTVLLGYICATGACIDNQKKTLLNSNTSLTCPYNMVNFGPLAAEIGSLVWGIPANFNGFRVLAAFLHCTLVVCVNQTLRYWTEDATYICHLYLARWPSCWALAHIYHIISHNICYGTYQPELSNASHN